jgi:hypothetical protein
VRGEEVPERPAPQVKTTEAEAAETEAAAQSESAPLAESATDDAPVEAATLDENAENKSAA